MTLSFLANVTGLIFNKEALKTTGKWLLMSGAATLFILIITKWISMGRPPIYGTYESMILGSFAALILFILLKRNTQNLILEMAIAICAIFMLAYGSSSDKTPAVLGVAFRSNWLWFHIGFSWLAYSAFVLASLFALYNLIPGKRIESLIKFMTAVIADDTSFKLIIFGFIAHTVAIAAGALWANDLYGRYWGWDPIETWSLIVWLIYATYLHLRVTLGWKGFKISLMAAVSPIAVLIYYGGIVFLNGAHGPLI